MSLTNSKESCVLSFSRASAAAPNQPGTKKVLGKCLLKKKGQAAWFSLWILVPPFNFQDKKETQHPNGVWERGGGGLQNPCTKLLFAIWLWKRINSHDMQEREWTCLHGPGVGKPAGSDGAIHKIPILLGNQVEGDYVASVTSQRCLSGFWLSGLLWRSWHFL